MRPDYKQTKWNGWGAPEKSFDLADRPGLGRFLSQKLGVYSFDSIPGTPLHEVSLSATRLTDGARKDLSAIVGAGNVKEELATRASHAMGKSYEDLVMARRGEVKHPPDAVVFPGGAREIRETLAWASDNNVAVVPFGGGTSVVGGVTPLCGPGQDLVIVVDLERMDKILYLDSKSQTAKVEPGMRGPILEECLQPHGLTLGHFPQSFEFSTVGGWIATRSAGESSIRYGGIEDLVVGLCVETPAGALEISGVPARAAGPEIKEFLIGSEGCLGIITLAEMRLHRRAESRMILSYLLPSFSTGTEAVRELMQQNFQVAMIQLYDEAETEAVLAFQPRATGLTDYLRRGIDRVVLPGRGLSRPSLLLLVLEGKKRRVEQDMRELSTFLDSLNGYDIGEGPGRCFERDRFLLPYLRDFLIGIGLMVGTFETALSWSGIPRLYSNFQKAVGRVCEERGVRCSIGCRISHAYSSGACLHFTVLAPAWHGEELRLWRACKLAAIETIIRGGGSLSHHYGIGSMHREWMMQENGPVGLAALRSLKEALDPAGILNPGKLIP